MYQLGVGSTVALFAELNSLATKKARSVKMEARKSYDLAVQGEGEASGEEVRYYLENTGSVCFALC
jgi:hypothetical protein